MLIAIEGIDGAGKTTACDALVDMLRGAGIAAQACRKSDITFDNAFADSRLHHLRDILWPPEGEPSEDLLGTHFYLYLLAAWFSAVSRRLSRFAGDTDEICIVDGSHYRVMAKAHARAGLDPDFLGAVFAHVTVPDLVVLLDAEPQLAWSRRASFKETEIGRWDGFDGDRQAAFCSYQSRIRSILIDFSKEKHWLVVSQQPETGVQDVVTAIINHMFPTWQNPKKILTG